MGASQRTKGHNWEREVARRFREAWPGSNARRGLQYRDGSEAPDVIVSGLHIECKRGRQPNPRTALRQAQEAAAKGTIPIAIVKDDRKPAYVVLLLEDYLDQMGELWELRNR